MAPHKVTSTVNYIAPMTERPRYHANDTSGDVLELETLTITVEDARNVADPPRLDREGFVLTPHASKIADFKDAAGPTASQGNAHKDEIAALVKHLSGADHVAVNAPGVLRFGEKSDQSGALNNSRPARFVHVDISAKTAEEMAMGSAPKGRKITRYAHFNVWRVITPPPQDVPLAVCDARSVATADLVFADAVFDEAGKPDWSFEGIVVAPNPDHRWVFYSGMTRDEALVFKTFDSDPDHPICVPHSAFNNPDCPQDTPPRGSIEMRAVAYWYE